MSENETLNAQPEEQPTAEQPAVEGQEGQSEATAETEEGERGAFDKFLYHQRRALEEASKAIDALIPEGFRTHSVEAQKEFQKGWKVLLDAAINELEKINNRAAKAEAEEEARPSTTGRTKVKVQVE